MGHTTKCCSVLKAEKDPSSITEDDLAFWSYVRPDARPTTLIEYRIQDSDNESASGSDFDEQ